MNKSIRTGWQNTILGEVLTFQRGFDITKKQLKPGKHDVIFSSGFGGKHNEYKVQAPGVVIGRKGTLGKVFFANSNFWATDTTLWVKNFHGNDEKFAYYFLHTMNLEQYDCGSANPTLNRNRIHSLPVSYPPIYIQKIIASILSAYDDLIENNTRRIEILESMAQTFYQEWFVKFRFPGHEQVKMVESDLGLIPEGWNVVQIGDVAKVGRGSSPRPIKDQKYFEEGTIPWIKIADATKSGKYLYQTKQKVNEYGASFSRLMPKGSMILATSGTLGYTQILGVEGCIHDGWLYLENYKGINQEYLYYVLLSKQKFFYNSAYGAAI